jgi:hypothetical protein
VGDTEVEEQRNWVHRVRKVSSELYVPTMMTPVFNHLLSLDFVCCTKKVSHLVKHPVVGLFDT